MVSSFYFSSISKNFPASTVNLVVVFFFLTTHFPFELDDILPGWQIETVFLAKTIGDRPCGFLPSGKHLDAWVCPAFSSQL